MPSLNSHSHPITYTPAIVAWIEDASGNVVGASRTLLAACYSRCYLTDADLGKLQRWLTDHADTYAAMAQTAYEADDDAEDPFPLTVRTGDSNGPEDLATIDEDGEVTLDGPGLAQCERCDAWHIEDDGYNVGDEHWCESCASDHSFTCDDCGDRFANDESNCTEDGSVICNGCRESYFVCEDCGDLCHNDRHNTVDGHRAICDSCIDSGDGHRYWSDGDGGWSTDPPEEEEEEPYHWSPPDGITDPESEEDSIDLGEIIPDCLPDCAATLLAMAQADPQRHERALTRVIGALTDSLRPRQAHQQGYGANPQDELRVSLPANPLHRFGVEVEHTGDTLQGARFDQALDGRAIYTRDSTVSGEVVTRCQGAGQIRRTLQRIAAAMAHQGPEVRCSNGTGLHIHADRAHLTPWEWWRLAHYVRDHADTLEIIGGRTRNDYGRADILTAQSWPQWVEAWKSGHCNRAAGLYLSHRHGTVEFRFCRYSTSPTALLARFAMVRLLIAVGRLPDSVKPSGEKLKNWLSCHPAISRLTGWTGNRASFHYSEAARTAPLEADLPPWQRFSADARHEVALLSVRLQVAERMAAWHDTRAEALAEAVNDARREWYRYSDSSPEERTARRQYGAAEYRYDAESTIRNGYHSEARRLRTAALQYVDPLQ